MGVDPKVKGIEWTSAPDANNRNLVNRGLGHDVALALRFHQGELNREPRKDAI
jgi:hypothetical protein